MTSQLKMEISYRVDGCLILKQNSSHFDAHGFLDCTVLQAVISANKFG